MSDDPENHVAGDLLIQDGKLELNGSFDGMRDGVWGAASTGLRPVRRDKTILGVTRNGGKAFTLEFFDEPSFTYTMSANGGYKADTYLLGGIFEGSHFKDTENLSFADYYVELPHLFEWVNDGIISIETVYLKDKPLAASSSTVKLEAPKDIQVFKADGFDLSFSIYRGGLKMSPPFRDVHVSQGCFLRIKPKQEMTLSEARGIIRHFQRLLGIAIGKSIEPIRFEARTSNGDKIIVHLRNPSPADYKHTDIEQMNFIYSDIAQSAQSVFEKWYGDMEKHLDMFDLFSSISSDAEKNINNRFKDIVSAIEGYVSVETGKLDVSPDKAFKTLNEYLPKENRPIPSGDYKKIRITRNKLSHLTLKSEDEVFVLDMEGKWVNAKRMIFLLEYALLKNLGVDDTMLASFYDKRKWHIN